MNADSPGVALRFMWLAILVVSVLLTAGYLVLGWTHEIYDLRGDGPGYMIAADYFSPFREASPVVREYAKSIFYPTLFPVFVGLLGASALAGHMVVAVAALLTVLTMFLWLRAEKMPLAACAVSALLFGLLPATYLQVLNIWSENVFLAFNMAAVYFVARAESRAT